MNILVAEPSGIGAGVQRIIEQFYVSPGPFTFGIRSESHPSLVFRIEGDTAAEVIAKAEKIEAFLKATPEPHTMSIWANHVAVSQPFPAYAIKMAGQAPNYDGMVTLMKDGALTEAGRALTMDR